MIPRHFILLEDAEPLDTAHHSCMKHGASESFPCIRQSDHCLRSSMQRELSGILSNEDVLDQIILF